MILPQRPDFHNQGPKYLQLDRRSLPLFEEHQYQQEQAKESPKINYGIVKFATDTSKMIPTALASIVVAQRMLKIWTNGDNKDPRNGRCFLAPSAPSLLTKANQSAMLH
jgi:hypothetical protein